MHGMVNRSIEHFLRANYGDGIWHQVATDAGVDTGGFNGLTKYPESVTAQLLRAASAQLDKTSFELLEDVGAWLVQLESLRRLLRFSGSSFDDFVFALEELPGRVAMVLPGLPFKPITVSRKGDNRYLISGTDWQRGLPWIVAGALRGMADDYGVLALIDATDDGVRLHVLVQEFSEARPFHLGALSAGGAIA